MKNKGILNTFIIVLAATLVFYGFSTMGALAVNTAVLSSNDLGDQTYVGPFNISGQKEKAAIDKLTTDLSELQSNLKVNLIYQDALVELPLEVIHYDVMKTIEQAKVQPGSYTEIPASAPFYSKALANIRNTKSYSVILSRSQSSSGALSIDKEILVDF